MLQTLHNILKNTGCSYCQENDYSDDKNMIKNWSLYLKESEMYSSLVLFNKNIKKDISFYCNVNDKIKLFKGDKLMIELEYISKNDNDNYAILVPLEKYNDYYSEIEKKNKTFDKNLDSFYVDDFDIQFVEKK